MPLQNEWVGYVARSYQQIKASVLSRMSVMVPEMTDHSEGNLLVKMVSVWAGLLEMLGYYVDNHARESHLITARLYQSMVKHARAHDYRIRGRIPASALVRVRFTGTGETVDDNTIPAGTEFRTAEGLKFFSTEDVEVSYGAGVFDYDVPVQQAEAHAEVILGTSSGLAYQEVLLDDPAIVDNSALVKISALAWDRKETLGFSLGYEHHYVQNVGMDGRTVIQFGDDYQGDIPTGASTITAEYKTTEGYAGNVGAGTIVEVDLPFSPPGVTVTVTNPESASGGTDTESIEQLRRRIPKAIRTMNRAVTEQDYIDISSEAPGVVKSGVRYDCGKYVEIFIVPEGGGIATPTLLSDTYIYMDDKKMITTNLVILPAGQVRIRFGISIRVLPQFNRSVVITALKTRLMDYMAAENQKIGGMVHLSDIYEVVEATPGIEWSDITTMTSVPYARPVNDTTVALAWTRTTQAASSVVVQWKIQMIGTADFQLFKNGSYIGTYTAGTPVNLAEIHFNVTGAYTLGDQWEFVTYPFFGNIALAEPSVPTTTLLDIVVVATGGS